MVHKTRKQQRNIILINDDKKQMKEKECLSNYKNKNERLNKFMAGFKQRKPQYEIYLKESQNPILPPIKKNMTYNNSVFTSPLKKKSSGKMKMKSVKKKLLLNI